MSVHQQPQDNVPRPKIIGFKEKKLLIFGMAGSGKSTLAKCMTEQDAVVGGATNMMKNTDRVHSICHKYPEFSLTVYDTEGFEGTDNMKVLLQCVAQLTDIETNYDLVVICVPVYRFTTIDDDFVQFLTNNTSEHFKKVAHVMLTHCTEKSFEENKQTAITKLKSFKDIGERLHRMYLPEMSQFIDKPRLEKEESRVREEILDAITNSHEKLRTKDILIPRFASSLPVWQSFLAVLFILAIAVLVGMTLRK